MWKVTSQVLDHFFCKTLGLNQHTVAATSSYFVIYYSLLSVFSYGVFVFIGLKSDGRKGIWYGPTGIPASTAYCIIHMHVKG
jgi:hypothetical protein